MTHTPEPWIVSRSNAGAIPAHFQPPEVLGRNGASCVATRLGNGPEAEANADRIAACVNACQGINPEAVPDLLASLQECEELICDSLESEYLHEDSHPGIWDFLAKIRATIAKAEGKA